MLIDCGCLLKRNNMKIAIQGHLTRGKEVIQILESLGGKNTEGLKGIYETFYYIDDKNEIGDDHKKYFPSTYKFYTLEEFEKEFPFKVGDRVISTTTNFIGTITKLKESGYYIKYDNGNVAFTPGQNLKLYKEMKEERNITLTLDKAKEWYNKGGELKEIALQAFSEKELNPLPRSWEEFCKQGNPIASWRYNIPIKYETLFKLEQLRNCWWGNWKPTWDGSTKYAIKRNCNEISIIRTYNTSSFLVFPTREMAEEFLECYKDLIEKAGDLI